MRAAAIRQQTSAAPEITADYVVQYAVISGRSVSEILGWLPLVAAARLSEGVQDQTASLLEIARRMESGR